jgi:hypothetical protein
MPKEKQTKKSKKIAKKQAKVNYDEICRYPTLNLGGLFLGLLVISFGFILLFYNLGMIKINFNWWHLWPVTIILVGLSLLNKRSMVNTLVGILAILTTIFIVFVAFKGSECYLDQLKPNQQPAVQNNQPAIQPAEQQQKTKINLFYYNKTLDTDITCGADFVLPVEREIVVTGTPIQDTINLLIQGKLSDSEISNGFKTQFPNPDFKLSGANLDSDGILTLTFSEVPGFTTGGACRTRILRNEIIKTAEQFSGVKKVILSPESLFQP